MHSTSNAYDVREAVANPENPNHTGSGHMFLKLKVLFYLADKTATATNNKNITFPDIFILIKANLKIS